AYLMLGEGPARHSGPRPAKLTRTQRGWSWRRPDERPPRVIEPGYTSHRAGRRSPPPLDRRRRRPAGGADRRGRTEGAPGPGGASAPAPPLPAAAYRR